ncbi:interleukin-22 receptor subunit alpha-1-like isoform X2 [Hypomesus transpacificus]|uniref:interleukin-22 receptor subunit alpha-1-like isoform X2 n=1 Tax=Hypomesus transpacificus TaxID=137520 RepID=UPI001F0842D4|nr:interleukin-22 receptor subunit alpha-1-like isoform X2 [Hypomesus transpacificus]
MTPLLMLPWILQAHLVMCEVPAPLKVNLSSNHFVHLLTWQPGPASPKDVYYNVSVASLKGNSWEPVAGCEHVVDTLLCNMTGSFPDRSEVYFCKVQAVLGQQVSPEAITDGFKPILDTHLDPPIVSLRACGRGLCVGLQPPVAGLEDVYESLGYALEVSFSSMETGQFSRKTKSLKEVILPDLAPGREYCVKVRIADNLEHWDSVYGSQECAHTLAIHTPDTEAAVGLCGLVVVGVVVVILLVHTEVLCLQTSLPQLLSNVKHHEKQLLTYPSSETLFSTVHVEALLPPPAETDDSSQSCEESEGEGEDGSGGKRGNYEVRPSASTMTNPLSSSSSSLSSSSISSSAQLLPCPIPGATAGQTSQSSYAPTEPECVRHQPDVPERQTEPAGTPDRPTPGTPDRQSSGTPDMQSSGTPDRPSSGTPDRKSSGTPDMQSSGTPDRPSPTRSGGGPLPACPLSGTGQSPEEAQCPPPSVDVRLKPRRAAETDRGTVEAGEPQEESGLDVNLLSVKLGGRWLEEGAEPKPGVIEEGAAVSSMTLGDWYCVEAEEEEQKECDGYMKR